MEIYFIRHTKVAIPEGICYGYTDVESASTFNDEIEKIKSKITIDKKFIFYSSPLKRCFNLGEALRNNSDLIIDNRLKELNFGEWELKAWKDIKISQIDEWYNDFVNKSCPKGESYIDLYNRTVDFWNDILKLKQSHVIVITHNGVIHTILSHILHIPLIYSFCLQIDFGGISKVNLENNFAKVEYINR